MRTLLLAALLLLNAPAWAEYAELSDSRISAIAEMLSVKQGGIGPVCADRAAWGQLPLASRLAPVLEDAERRLSQAFPAWDNEAYLEYSRNGSRSNGERMMSARKTWIYPLVLAECVEYKGRFLPSIERTLTELSSQPSWTAPAHDTGQRNFKSRNYEVDLFAADLAHDLAQTLYMLGEKIKPEVRQKALAELEARVFAPLRRTFAEGGNDNRWLKLNNNWNAVCLKGSVAAALAVLPDRHDRALFAAAGEHYIGTYLEGFPNDGYSIEGPSYWNYGFSHFAELREVLMHSSSNQLDLFVGPKIRSIALYGQRIEMLPDNIAAFGDASPREKIDRFTLAYSNQALSLGLPIKMQALPISTSQQVNSAPLARTVGILFARPQAISGRAESLDPLRSYFNQVGVLVTRPAPGSGSKLAASIKAGGNGNHSHNDIGSYTIALGTEQPVGDVGTPPYSRKTFSKAERYSIKAINSYGHPVPVVAGKLQLEATKVTPKVLATRFTSGVDEITLDLTAAYDVAALRALTRTLRHDRAGNGTVTIEDHFKFDNPQPFENALTTLGNWKQRSDDTLELSQKNQLLLVRIEASAPYDIIGEKIDEDGMRFTRIAIRLKNPQQTGWIRLEMRAG